MPDSRQRSTLRSRPRAAKRRRVDPRYVGAAVLGIGVTGIGAGLLVTWGPAGAPVAVDTPVVTQVAVPDFGEVAQKNAADSSPPDIATPTPGVAGPTAVVVTSSPW